MINQNITFSPALSALGVQQRPQVSLGANRSGKLGANLSEAVTAGAPIYMGIAALGGATGALLSKRHRILGGGVGAIAALLLYFSYGIATMHPGGNPS